MRWIKRRLVCPSKEEKYRRIAWAEKSESKNESSSKGSSADYFPSQAFPSDQRVNGDEWRPWLHRLIGGTCKQTRIKSQNTKYILTTWYTLWSLITSGLPVSGLMPNKKWSETGSSASEAQICKFISKGLKWDVLPVCSHRRLQAHVTFSFRMKLKPPTPTPHTGYTVQTVMTASAAAQ